MLLSEDEMEVTVIDSVDPYDIQKSLFDLGKKLSKLESQQRSVTDENNVSSSPSGNISGDFRSGPNSSESSSQNTPKSHAIVLTGETLVNIPNKFQTYN